MRGNRPGTTLPAPLQLVAAATVAFLLAPLIGLLLRVPWGGLVEILARPATRDALRLSLIVSTTAAALCVLLGLPLALVLARLDFPGRRLVRAVVTLPMVLPPVVAGTALLFGLGRRGFVGQVLARFGVSLPFTTAGAVVAATFVSLPFFVITVEGAIAGNDERFEEVGAALGAGPWRRLTRVTLPLLRPALVAGTLLSWSRALGEFGATITFAGNLAGRTQTLPLATFLALESDPDAALTLSALLLFVSLTILIALRGRWLTR